MKIGFTVGTKLSIQSYHQADQLIMQTHATMYCKYYQLQVLYTLFSPLGQVFSWQGTHQLYGIYCLQGGFNACNLDWIRVNQFRSTHLMMWIRIQIGLWITTIALHPDLDSPSLVPAPIFRYAHAVRRTDSPDLNSIWIGVSCKWDFCHSHNAYA